MWLEVFQMGHHTVGIRRHEVLILDYVQDVLCKASAKHSENVFWAYLCKTSDVTSALMFRVWTRSQIATLNKSSWSRDWFSDCCRILATRAFARECVNRFTINRWLSAMRFKLFTCYWSCVDGTVACFTWSLFTALRTLSVQPWLLCFPKEDSSSQKRAMR